jgi:hypothetical protein
MDGVGGYEGWRWMYVTHSMLDILLTLLKFRRFILEGLLTVVVGAISFKLMSPFPEKAKFLNETERSWVINRVKYKGSAGPNKIAESDAFKWKYV